MRRLARFFAMLMILTTSFTISSAAPDPFCWGQLEREVNAAVLLFERETITESALVYLITAASLNYNLCELNLLY